MIKKQPYLYFSLWVCCITLFYFSFEFISDGGINMAYLLSFICFQITSFFVNTYHFLPKLYDKKRYILFGISNSLFIICNATLSTLIEFPENLFNYASSFDIEEFLAHAVPSILAVFIAFAIHMFYKIKIQEQKTLEIITAEKNFLIQQINPHFLFNVLNNIYSLSIENSTKTSDAILQLSKLLDYSLYGNQQEFVSLKSEIDYISNFIGLYKLKDDDIKHINFKYTNTDMHCKIAPMLLLPFVENAFKHGSIEDLEHGFIDIRIATSASHIVFSCKNSCSISKQVDTTGGIGISNVTRRLQLIYPNAHKLTITNDDTIFSVELKLKRNAI